jgi:tyrosinase
LIQRSNIGDVNAALKHQRGGLLPLVYAIFTSESDYTNMSCTSSTGNSIESIHNSVHQAVGGRGHMSDLATSAFDPIFWLHHTNIDRLFAMWQSINPQSYVVPTMNAFGTYAEPRGFVDTEDSNLLPFHSDNESGFWTSSEVRSTRTFGYAYQDTVDWNLTEATLASNVRSSVNKLYSSVSVNGTSRQRGSMSMRNTELLGLESDTLNVASKFKGKEQERQWTIKVQMQRFAHHSPFSLDFFVGPPPILPSAWSTASNLIGSHAQLIAANINPTLFNESQHTLSHGEVSLTHYLTVMTERGELASLEPDSVMPFLTKFLNWRARDMEGCEVQPDSLAALSIGLGSKVMRPAKFFSRFPTFTGLETYEDITAGKPGRTGQEQSAYESCYPTA